MCYDVILLACEYNSWCVEPYLYLADKFWPDSNTILVAENNYLPEASSYQFRQLPDHICPSGSCLRNKFSDSLIWALQNTDNKTALIMLADYWIYENVDVKSICQSAQYLIEHPDILRIDIGMQVRPNGPFNSVDDDYLECSESKDCFYPISLTPALWNKHAYLQLLENNWDPWQVEIFCMTKYMSSTMRSLVHKNVPISYLNAMRGRDDTSIIVHHKAIENVRRFIPNRFQIGIVN